MPPVEKNCLTCKWYVETSEDQGECHAHPPSQIPPHTQFTYHGWPIVNPSQYDQSWCGEYKPTAT